MSSNLAILAAAGSCKTQYIIDEALRDPARQILITTYTNENLAQIRRRLGEAAGIGLVPDNISTMSWYTFLISQCAKPYQRSLLEQPNVIRSLNFHGERKQYVKREQSGRYFLDSNADMYRDGVAHFSHDVNVTSGGLVMRRLSEMYDRIYIDELQDLVGWDLEVIEQLLDAEVGITMVGDPRQRTYSTNRNSKNRKFRGEGFADWLKKRARKCLLEARTKSHRCNQQICDLADSLFPALPATTSLNTTVTGHDGIFEIPRSAVADYVNRHRPVILRHSKATDTLGLSAVNFGASKGSTYDRVLIFPTRPMLKYLTTRDPAHAGSKDKMYVAITRARFSVTFVVGND